jgi:uncharacterized membrane protein
MAIIAIVAALALLVGYCPTTNKIRAQFNAVVTLIDKMDRVGVEPMTSAAASAL